MFVLLSKILVFTLGICIPLLSSSGASSSHIAGSSASTLKDHTSDASLALLQQGLAASLTPSVLKAPEQKKEKDNATLQQSDPVWLNWAWITVDNTTQSGRALMSSGSQNPKTNTTDKLSPKGMIKRYAGLRPYTLPTQRENIQNMLCLKAVGLVDQIALYALLRTRIRFFNLDTTLAAEDNALERIDFNPIAIDTNTYFVVKKPAHGPCMVHVRSSKNSGTFKTTWVHHLPEPKTSSLPLYNNLTGTTIMIPGENKEFYDFTRYKYNPTTCAFEKQATHHISKAHGPLPCTTISPNGTAHAHWSWENADRSIMVMVNSKDFIRVPLDNAVSVKSLVINDAADFILLLTQHVNSPSLYFDLLKKNHETNSWNSPCRIKEDHPMVILYNDMDRGSKSSFCFADKQHATLTSDPRAYMPDTPTYKAVLKASEQKQTFDLTIDALPLPYKIPAHLKTQAQPKHAYLIEKLALFRQQEPKGIIVLDDSHDIETMESLRSPQDNRWLLSRLLNPRSTWSPLGTWIRQHFGVITPAQREILLRRRHSDNAILLNISQRLPENTPRCYI